MKIDFDQPIKNFDGTVVKQNGADLTLGLVCAMALNGAKATDAKVALHRGSLALKVYSGGSCDMSPEDCSACRAVLHEAWQPVVVAQAYRMLDPSMSGEEA